MKKITLLAFVVLSLASCTKNYNCRCLNADDTPAGEYVVHGTKAKATKSCEAYNQSGSVTCRIQ